ncbi:hypothetical protein MRX96_030532 [Rhipicephalus microplus]|uniref:MIT domain-containing protein n=1 Tax=Rhipicephalus microplus TaxID=6941 RepID=A0A9J6DNM2_RHIMP|nr:hypothetical protein HPB51_014525 [Rhipicephalus microplus]
MGGMNATIYLIHIDLFRLFPAHLKAIRTATRAVEEDEKHNYPKALRLYKQTIKDFHRAMQREALTERSKQMIREKCAMYSDRAALIRDYLYGNSDKEGLIDSDDERPKRRFWLCCC